MTFAAYPGLVRGFPQSWRRRVVTGSGYSSSVRDKSASCASARRGVHLCRRGGMSRLPWPIDSGPFWRAAKRTLSAAPKRRMPSFIKDRILLSRNEASSVALGSATKAYGAES